MTESVEPSDTDMLDEMFKGKLKRLMKIYDGECFYCGVTVGHKNSGSSHVATIDHYVPKVRGGSNSICNLRLSCFKCNVLKGCKMPEELNEEQIGRLRKFDIYSYNAYRGKDDDYYITKILKLEKMIGRLKARLARSEEAK